jgi:hypothetical protein
VRFSTLLLELDPRKYDSPTPPVEQVRLGKPDLLEIVL